MVIVATKLGAADMTQTAWDTMLVATPKLLSDLDADSNTKVAKLSMDGVPIEVLAAIPAVPVVDDIYYDTVSTSYKRYNGSTWDTVEFIMEAI